MVGASTLGVQTNVDYFESLYQDAHGDISRVSWADPAPNPALVTWLNAVAPSMIRSGARVACVGCGLGEDARELMRRGYDVTAFDCSPTAIRWVKQIDQANARCYEQADLFNAPLRWRHRFDLVVEVNTIHALSPDLHRSAMSAIAGLMSPHGHLLVICRGVDEQAAIEDGPPWPLSERELLEAASGADLRPVDTVCKFMDDEEPPVCRMRALFKRA